MKVGIELKIDVTKIDKQRLYRGEKGTYLTMTAFVDLDEKDQYGNSGMITHKKNEGEDRAPILGNSKVFWSDMGNGAPTAPPQQQHAPNGVAQYQQSASAPNAAQSHSSGHGGYQQQAPAGMDFGDDKIPF